MRHVVILVDRSGTDMEHLMMGVADFAASHRWRCTYAHPWWDGLPNIAPRAEGICAFGWAKELLDAAASYGVPVVDICNMQRDPRIARVGPDEHAIGKVGAEHLLERGFTQFAFFGAYSFRFSKEREAGFRQTLQAAGYDAAIHDANDAEADTNSTPQWLGVRKSTLRWLSKQSTPLGVMTALDCNAGELTEACHQLGLRVPEDVAILGVGNDDLHCTISQPPLSSVAVPFRRIGYEAAALLEQMMNGEPTPTKPLLLSPTGVITRQSTDVLAVPDPDVAQSLRIIRQNMAKDFTIADLLQQVPVSRRALEDRFRKMIGRTPHEELLRLRLQRAQDLLATTDLPMSEVAAQSGFRTAVRLAVVFREKLNTTPRHYRRQYSTNPAVYQHA